MEDPPRFPPRVEEIVGESRAGGETSEEEKKKLLDKRELCRGSDRTGATWCSR